MLYHAFMKHANIMHFRTTDNTIPEDFLNEIKDRIDTRISLHGKALPGFRADQPT